MAAGHSSPHLPSGLHCKPWPDHTAPSTPQPSSLLTAASHYPSGRPLLLKTTYASFKVNYILSNSGNLTFNSESDQKSLETSPSSSLKLAIKSGQCLRSTEHSRGLTAQSPCPEGADASTEGVQAPGKEKPHPEQRTAGHSEDTPGAVDSAAPRSRAHGEILNSSRDTN